MRRVLFWVTLLAAILAILGALGVDTAIFASDEEALPAVAQGASSEPSGIEQRAVDTHDVRNQSFVPKKSRGTTDLSMAQVVELLHPVQAQPLSRRAAQESLVRREVHWTGYVFQVSLRDRTDRFGGSSSVTLVADPHSFDWPVICNFDDQDEEQIYNLRRGDEIVFTGLLYNVDDISLRHCQVLEHVPYIEDQE